VPDGVIALPWHGVGIGVGVGVGSLEFFDGPGFTLRCCTLIIINGLKTLI
jgi:hypothetical protein